MATTVLVQRRVAAKLPEDQWLFNTGGKETPFPLYDSGRLFAAGVIAGANALPALLLCLSAWLGGSPPCWWLSVALCGLADYLLLETWQEGTARFDEAKKKRSNSE